jgi:hypothetical protein
MGAKNNNLKPGQTAPASGQYPVVGPRGGKTNKEVTVIKDRPMPPTQKPGETYGKPGETYGKPDLTKNKSGTGAKRK